MHKTTIKKLQLLIERFKVLSEEPFNRGKRDHHLDDLFAEFLRTALDPGTKIFKDEIHKGIRTRSFVYESDNHKCDINVTVQIVQGQKDRSVFICKSIFR